MNLLVCYHDEEALKSLDLALNSRQFKAYGIDMGEEAIELGKLYDYDAIVLGDTVDVTTAAVIKALRDNKIKTPILVLSGNAETATVVRALDLGADDYLTMPFIYDELVARLTAIVRRSKGHARSVIALPLGVTLDINARSAHVDGKPVYLTGKEYAALELLALRQGNVQTKETFLNHLYGGFDEPEIKIIDVFICKLRKKVPPDLIQTVWGRGYLIAKPGADGTTSTHASWGFRREETPHGLSEHTVRELVG